MREVSLIPCRLCLDWRELPYLPPPVQRKCSPSLCSGYLHVRPNHRFFYKLTMLFQEEYLIGAMQPFLCFLAADTPFSVCRGVCEFFDLKSCLTVNELCVSCVILVQVKARKRVSVDANLGKSRNRFVCDSKFGQFDCYRLHSACFDLLGSLVSSMEN